MHEGIAQNVSLMPYTSYRIGGKAKFLVKATDTDLLLRALELSDNRLILGKGSKVLVSDSGFDGVVILMRIKNTDFKKGRVYAGAGVSLPMLSRMYMQKGLKGLEWACGIPASIGGALKLNAGAYGGDMSQIVNFVDILRDGKKIRLLKEECALSYRNSGFLNSDIILGAELLAEAGEKEEIARLMSLYTNKRTAAQPSGFCCGSVFKGAEKPAYTYIKDCGFKRLSIGDAFLSEKHANFILNRGFASARQVYNLIRTIKAEVFVKSGTKLKEEVIYIGEF